jgi:hypothetical protein
MTKSRQDESAIATDQPKRKPGRPPRPDKPTDWIGAKVHKYQHAEAKARAARAKLGLGAWIIRQCGLDEIT